MDTNCEALNDQIFLQLVHEQLKKRPNMLRQVIDAATDGVCAYADRQSDHASKLQFKLMVIMDAVSPDIVKDGKIGGVFTVENILGELTCFMGTTGLANLRTKFGLKPETEKKE